MDEGELSERKRYSHFLGYHVIYHEAWAPIMQQKGALITDNRKEMRYIANVT